MSVIKEELRFETFNDFYLRRLMMRENFQTLSSDEREIYKYYVYSNSLLSTLKKDLIWEYLCEPKLSPYYVWEKDMERYYNKGDSEREYKFNKEDDLIDSRGYDKKED